MFYGVVLSAGRAGCRIRKAQGKDAVKSPVSRLLVSVRWWWVLILEPHVAVPADPDAANPARHWRQVVGTGPVLQPVVQELALPSSVDVLKGKVTAHNPEKIAFIWGDGLGCRSATSGRRRERHRPVLRHASRGSVSAEWESDTSGC